jgi:hypothetical protein
MINIIKDKDAIWETDKYDVILVGTSIYCMLTNGFQSKLRIKYPYIEDINNSTNYGDLRKLGKRMTIQGNPIISLMYIAKYPHSKREFVDYDALEHALATANAEFRGKKVMTTMLGCSKFDGNGDRDKVLEIMERNATNIDLYVYDYPQLEKRKEIALHFRRLRDIEFTEPEKFAKIWPIRKKLIKDLYLEF